jgi:hypothetical protein
MANSKPNPNLKSLNKLVGIWKISGDAKGQIEYTWAEGGYFLIQKVDLEYCGKQIRGIEVIGHLQKVGEEPSRDIWSRFYHFTEGLMLDYVYELVDNTLTIWFGKKNSNNFYRGIFSEDGSSFKGAWQWPGGGYSMIAKKQMTS